MITTEQLDYLKNLLPTIKSVLVLVGPKPTNDQLASAVALSMSLSEAGKDVLIASPEDQTEKNLPVVGLDLVKTQLGSKNLDISFAYSPTAVDKVSYHIDEDQQRFHLVIKPQRAERPLDTSTVTYEYSGAEADVIFLVGVHEFEALAQLYEGYEQLYQTALVVTIHSFEPAIGTLKLNTSGAGSLSEAMARLLTDLELPVSAESATNLLYGIEEMTDNFKSFSTTADTFEIASQLLRNGARRIRRTSTNSSSSPAQIVSSSKSATSSSTPKNGKAKTNPPSKPQDGPRTFYP